MFIREMSSQECSELLARVGFGRLACALDGQPYVVPIYFAYESDCIYGFSTLGQKIEWMRLNPRVCVEADEVQSYSEWATVISHGRYEELPDTPVYSTRRRNAQSLLEHRSAWWQTGLAASQVRIEFNRDSPIFYCIHITETTGHHASPNPAEPGMARA